MFELRNYNKPKQPTRFESPSALEKHLRQHHIGDHVAVRFKLRSGIKSQVFVTVTETEIKETYGSGQLVDFNLLVR